SCVTANSSSVSELFFREIVLNNSLALSHFHSPLNLTPLLSSRRFLPVSSCCIRAFFCCWLLASSCSVVVIALSQVERIWAIFFCSGGGGSKNTTSLRICWLRFEIFVPPPFLDICCLISDECAIEAIYSGKAKSLLTRPLIVKPEYASLVATVGKNKHRPINSLLPFDLTNSRSPSVKSSSSLTLLFTYTVSK